MVDFRLAAGRRFIQRDRVGATLADAHAATHALGAVDENETALVVMLGVSLRRADLDAGRIVAVVAAHRHIAVRDVLVPGTRQAVLSPATRFKAFDVTELTAVREVMLVAARNDAGLAAGAARGIKVKTVLFHRCASLKFFDLNKVRVRGIALGKRRRFKAREHIEACPLIQPGLVRVVPDALRHGDQMRNDAVS